MRKIPTLFQRDPDNMARVLREVHPDCEWVIDGWGQPTRKIDGTCTMFDGVRWWARREVKLGKAVPAEFQVVEHDEVTGKTVGWEPIEQSPFAKHHAEALDGNEAVLDEWPIRVPVAGGTYELIGPKINGNPEGVEQHMLVRHGYLAHVERAALEGLPRTFDGLAAWLAAHTWEGIVWHAPDGRMAKLKKRDFGRVSP